MIIEIMERKRISIVGLGLIGGSLAIQLNEKGLASRIIGVDANTDHANKALELGLVDEIVSLEQAVKQADVIILAIPVDSLVKILPGILDLIENQIVIDLGSTKSQLLQSVYRSSKKRPLCCFTPHVGNRIQWPNSCGERGI